MTVAELGERMSSQEFRDWMVFDSIEPFGDTRADLRQALTTSMMYNIALAQSNSKKRSTYKDFMPFDRSRKASPSTQANEPRSPEVLAAKFAAFTGGKG